MTVQELKIDDRFTIWNGGDTSRGHFIGKGHDQDIQRVIYKIIWMKDNDPYAVTERAYTCNEIITAVEKGHWNYIPQTRKEKE